MNTGKNLAVWAVIVLLVMVLANSFEPAVSMQRQAPMSFSDFMTQVEAGHVADVVIQGKTVTGVLNDGTTFKLYVPEDPTLVPSLRQYDVQVTALPIEEEGFSLIGVLVSWFPMLLLVGVWIFFMRQMQSGGGKAMSFGKSKARMLDEHKNKITFKDVAGIDEAKEELEEIIDFLRDPKKFQRLGGKIPKGVLLVGPPGTGKTLLARAIAGEADVPFFSISGSDFVEMFVGVGASRVRDMFEQGKKSAPCLIFIDEIDAVGRHRGAGLGGGNDEREQTLNQLLVEMDGFETNEGVILIAATNRPDVLDPALLRPGRFDRQVVVPNPDLIGREKILLVHMEKVPLGPDVDAKVIARGTPGFSGADLANLVNEAALIGARRNKRVITMSDFEYAKDKVMMGVERRSMVMSDDEKRNTAFHEAGHAICALHEAESDPIHKATIIPRGRALGMVMRLPERDHLSSSIAKLEADLTVAMGGRVAEELMFGANKVTNGAAQDIKVATSMARKMVTEWGMSKLGPLCYGEPGEEVFLGHSVTQHKPISDETAKAVDEEVFRIVDDAHKRATKILTDHKHELEILGQGLLEYETLTGDEIKALLNGEPINPGFHGRSNDDKPRSSVPETEEEGGNKIMPGISPEPDPAGS